MKLLTKLGLEPPPQLQRRVVTEKIIPRIKCNVDNRYPGSKTEVCFIEITANSSDGVIRDHWLGDSWGVVHGLGHKKKKAQRSATGKIVVYDRSLMNQIPALMIPLEMKRSGYEPRHHANITRKFPARFVEWLKSLPPEIPVELCGELDSLSRAPVAGTVRLEVAETEIDWFDLQVVLDVNDTNLNQDELKLLLNAKGNWVRLDDKGWQRLEFNLSEQEDETLARLGLNPREMSSEPQRMHALQLADPAAGKFLPEEQAKQIRRRADEIKTRVAPRVPPAVGGQLRPYQKDGFHFLAYLAANNFGGVLADDMGLGKTLQALTWLTWLLKQKGNRRKPSLVVCPKSVVDNWHAEADRFVPGLRVRIWLAADFRENLDKLGDPQEADLHVINYTQLRTARKSLVAVQWLAVILDEGQYIKNPNSQTAQAARSLKTGNRLVMTGTPIENRLLDLWSLMAFAMPGVLGNRTEFARVYNAKADPLARLRLSSRVRPFLLRRTKGQVAKDLPDRIEEDLFCELEGEQSRLYHAELKRAQQMLLSTKTQKELAKQRFHFLTSLLRLRQICCHPKLVNPGSNAASAKVESFLDQVTPLMESGQKVLVFSQFVENLKLLKEIVENKSWAHYYLAGDTQNRGELVEEFQTCPGAAIFLISLKAGGSGLNLMAASYVVLFDPWWNPAVENQAIDRTHRIGQSQNVIAFRLLAKGTIEEKIRIMQTQKQALAEDVLGEEKFAKALSLDDFKFLFSD
ncbi:MAG: DEAD/DEAH box helicase [Verrucomicrobia bacterium]|nr:DEAD/DEAH box helicase [Verrucomicrobiota bacterium]